MLNLNPLRWVSNRNLLDGHLLVLEERDYGQAQVGGGSGVKKLTCHAAFGMGVWHKAASLPVDLMMGNMPV